jgi:hypothetical protein
MLSKAFMARFEDGFEQYKRGRLTGEEAGELMGMSGRNFRQLAVREDGIEGLRDRRIGKVSPRRYSDFTVKQLVQRHNYKLCYTVTRLSLQAAGLVAKACTGA